jgi:cytochrome c
MFKRRRALIALQVALANCVSAAATAESYDLGRTPTSAAIAAWDIAIGPLGAELPTGHGTAEAGADLFAQKCAMCHGATGREGPDPVLVGGQNTLATDKPIRTIGSYWPYATTIFDYVRRAMPLQAPGSLRPDEVYALTAYLLYANGIIEHATIIDGASLPQVLMPNRHGFVVAPRD